MEEYKSMENANEVKSVTIDTINWSNYDQIYDLFDGYDCLFGTNTDYLRKQISKLETKGELTNEDKSILYKHRCELGELSSGLKKPRVCWNYVHNGTCYHTSSSSLERGEVIGGLWHPDVDEKAYLCKKKKKF